MLALMDMWPSVGEVARAGLSTLQLPPRRLDDSSQGRAAEGGAAADTVAAVPQQQAAALDQRRAEQAARRREAIRELQEHAAQGYRPGPDVMEGARDGGVLGLTEYVEALLGWDEETWAKVKRVGNYGCATPLSH